MSVQDGPLPKVRYTLVPHDDGGFVAQTIDGSQSAWGSSEDAAEDALGEQVGGTFGVHLALADGATS